VILRVKVWLGGGGISLPRIRVFLKIWHLQISCILIIFLINMVIFGYTLITFRHTHIIHDFVG